MKKVVIIGAGPAGITAGLELVKQSRDYDVTILEASSQVGGLAKTVVCNSGRMDLGGHRFITKNEDVKNWWEEILQLQGQPALDDRVLKRYSKTTPGGPDPEFEDEVMLSRKRVASVHYNGKFFEYPVKFNSGIIKNIGIGQTAKAGFSYLESSIFKKKESNLEYFYINHFGKNLYQSFFEGYTEKLWGRHPSQISSDWGSERLKGLSVKSILKDGKKKNGQDSAYGSLEDAEEFLYPKLGPGQFWELAAKRFEEYGGRLRLNCHVSGIETENNVIKGVRCVLEGQEFFENADIVISSMPMKDLLAGLKGVPFSVEEVGKGLPYRDLVVIGILVPSLKLKNTSKIKTFNDQIPDCWIYVQDNSVKLGRIQIYNNWSPYLTSNPKESVWIGLEYFCNEGDYYWNQNDVQWQNLALSELSKLGILENNPSVLDFHKEMVPKAYPAYFDTYPRFDEIRRYLDSYPNLYCVGRNGQHRYFNMDQVMLTSMEAVRGILSGKTEKTKVWNVNDVGGYHPAPASNQLITPAPGTETSRPKIYVEGAADNRNVNSALAAASAAAREGVSEDGKRNPLMSIKDRLSMRSFRKPKQPSNSVNYALLSDAEDDSNNSLNSYRTAAIPIRSNYQDPGERPVSTSAPIRRKPSGIKKESSTGTDTYVVHSAPVKKETAHIENTKETQESAAAAETAAVAASAAAGIAAAAAASTVGRQENEPAPAIAEAYTEPAIEFEEVYEEPVAAAAEPSPAAEEAYEEPAAVVEETTPVVEEVYEEPAAVVEETTPVVEEVYEEPAAVVEETTPVVEEVYEEPAAVVEETTPVVEEVYEEPAAVVEETTPVVEEVYEEPAAVVEETTPVVEEVYEEPAAVVEETTPVVEEVYEEPATVVEETAPAAEESVYAGIGSAKFNPNETYTPSQEPSQEGTVFTPHYYHKEVAFDPEQPYDEYDYYADYGSRREEYDSLGYDSSYGNETYQPAYEETYAQPEETGVSESAEVQSADTAGSEAAQNAEDGAVQKSNDFGNIFAMPTEEETRRKSTAFDQPYIPLDKPEISLVPKKEEKKEFLNQTGPAFAIERIEKVMKTELSLKPKPKQEEAPVEAAMVVSVPRPSYRVAKGVFTPKPITPEEKAKMEEEERAKRPIAPSINFKKAPEEPKEEEKKPQHKVRKKNFVKPVNTITADWETMNAKTLRELPEMEAKVDEEEKAEIKVQKSDLPNYDIFGEMSFDGKKEKKKETKKDPAAAAIAASIEAARLKEEQAKEEFRARVKAAEEATKAQIEAEAEMKKEGTFKEEHVSEEKAVSQAPAVTIQKPEPAAKPEETASEKKEVEKKENYVHHLTPSEIEVPKDLFANARVIAVIKNGVKTSTTADNKATGETTVKKTIQKYTSDFETTTVKSIRKLRAKRQEEAIRSITSMLEGSSERKVVQPRPKSPAVDLTKEEPAVTAVTETAAVIPAAEPIAEVAAASATATAAAGVSEPAVIQTAAATENAIPVQEEIPAPENTYEEPVYEAPSYETPAEEPVYETPSYEAPAEEPVYEAPSYEVPAEESVYENPSYEEPVAETSVAETESISEEDTGFKLDLRLKDGSHRVIKDFPLVEEPVAEVTEVTEEIEQTESVISEPVEIPANTETAETEIISEAVATEEAPAAAEAEETPAAEIPAEEVPAEKPKRTYRKRTPKTETETVTESAATAEQTEAPAEAPKKRGRKPKAETAVVLETAENGDEIVAVKKPRKPRAKKTEDASQLSLDLTQSAQTVTEAVSAEAEAVTEVSVEKPKRSYRKRTTKVVEESAETISAGSTPAEEAPAEKPKRTYRKRTPKTDVTADVTTENTSEE